jgi:diaminohydroxyphosphoribosylaminopyrimidine deaminase/5-amino-6-(5-phosphoribosylamino)uracil reductase
MISDEQAMKRAAELALNGTGRVSPNPRVGCVIVKNGEIISEGWHNEYGGPHAEVEAIRNSSQDVTGSTLYVNLEPCGHAGKTPPCTDLIIEKKIKRVVAGMIDPNPEVSGKGIQALQNAGIETNVGVLESECHWINRFFVKYITTGQPYVIMKVGQSLDGCVATIYGQSKWITSEESRTIGHQLRAETDAVLVGGVTAEKDNPELTVRLVKGRNPKRVILDSDLSVSLKAKVYTCDDRHNTFVFCRPAALSKPKAQALKISGVNINTDGTSGGDYLNLRAVLEQLVSSNVTSVLVEGGARVFSSFASEQLIDEIHLFIAPIAIGSGLHTFSSLSVPSLNIARKFDIRNASMAGPDVYIVATRRQVL